MTEQEHKLYLIDGSGFIFRAFHALPPLTTSQGTPIGAVLGFCTMLFKLWEEKCPTYWAVVFDSAQPTFRKHLYAQYKANRTAPPEELVLQFDLIRKACNAFNVPTIEVGGFEADDLIASYAVQGKAKGWEIEVVSSDKDLMQLVTTKIDFYDPMKNKHFGKEAIKEKWGVLPQQITDVQALVGDKIDNIPGIPGIGIKTASAWIDRFGSLENLLQNYHEIAQIKKRELIHHHKETALLSYQLAKLKEDIPLPLPIEALSYQAADPIPLSDFLQHYEFTTLYDRLMRKGFLSSPAQTEKKPCILTEEMLTSFYEAIENKGQIALFFDQTDAILTQNSQKSICGVGLCYAEDSAFYLPLEQDFQSIALPFLKKILENSAILKIVHDAKTLISVLEKKHTELTPFDDVMLLSYVIEGGVKPHAISDIFRRTLPMDSILRHLSSFEGQDNAAYAAQGLLKSHSLLKTQLHACRSATIYENLERPLALILAQMEKTGILLDQPHLKALHAQLEIQLKDLEKIIYSLASTSFNIGSPKQLGEVLFEQLKWEGGKKGKSGAYQTSSEVLETFADQGYELATNILQWRHLAKLKNTYTEALLRQVNPLTGRISTSYNMVETTTGRLSSVSPNLQNIPIRTPLGKEIRKAFIATEGTLLLSLDYSQIELRLLAHMAPIPELQQAFQAHEDIHAQTASKLFGCPISEVTSEYRRKAKIINFGIIYGMSAFGLSKQLGISTKQAQEYIDRYFNKYPGASDYIERTKKEAQEKGFVQTLWRRRCKIPNILHPNYIARSAAERQAINAPLQGSSADIIKRAMIHSFNWIHQENLQINLLLQIHDELIFEIPEDQEKFITPSLKKIMKESAFLSVPLEINATAGKRWE